MALSYEISLEAEEDWYNITRYTLKNFGERQVQKYTDRILKCSDDLANGIGQFKEMNISGNKILSKHCQKHYIFALSQPNQPLLIIAILHEQMDLMKRLKKRLN